MTVALARIGDIVTVRGGGTPSKARKEFYTGRIPWVTPKDMKSWHISRAQDNITEDAIEKSATNLIPKNAVLLVNRSGILKHTLPIGVNTVPVAINQDLKALICGDRVVPEYLARLIKASEPKVLSWVRATTADNFAIENLKNLEIPLPSIAEQRRISAILDQADELRRWCQKAIERLNDLGQSIFNEMFGDPATNPKQWPTGIIRDLVREVKYGTAKKAHVEERGIAVLRMGNVTFNGELDLGDLKYVELREEELQKYIVERDDLIFNRTNSKDLVGKTTVFDLDEKMVIAGYLIRARTNEKADPYYVSGYLNSPHGKKTLRNLCKNIVGMANINAQELQNIPICIPPIALQKRYRRSMEHIAAQRNACEQEQAKLDVLFASLQQRAFAGEL